MPESLLPRVLDELGVEQVADFGEARLGASVPLRSRLSTGRLAWASVAAVTHAAGLPVDDIDPQRVAAAYRSDRALTVDGATPPVWSAYSGFWRTADGWVRTHGNYPHHARALLRGLGLSSTDANLASPDPTSVASVLSTCTSAQAAERIGAAGGLAVIVSREQASVDADLRSTPLLAIDLAGAPSRLEIIDAPPADGPPLAGIRVLDVTRVIAGPVCTRTLALLGADVLRIDPPYLPEPDWQHLDTGHGKRSALLDARTSKMEELLAAADAVVLGYRPAALARLALDPDSVAQRHPHLVIAQLTAWGADHPDRAGFDSLVQAESGIAWIESADGTTPGALPAQALDHSAGYLLAAAVTTLLRGRRAGGGSRRVSTSLRRIAAELLGLPRADPSHDPGPASAPVPPSLRELRADLIEFAVGGRTVTTARPALPGLDYSAPRPWGSDDPRW